MATTSQLPAGVTLDKQPASHAMTIPSGVTLDKQPTAQAMTIPAGVTLDKQPAVSQPSGIGKVADWMENSPAGASDISGRLAAGAVKSAASGLGGILDMISHPKMPAAYGFAYQQDHPGSSAAEAEQSYENDYKQTFGGKIAGHIQDAAHWLRTGSEAHGFWENVGAIGEQTLEYMGTDGLLKVAGGGAAAAKGAAQATEGLKNAQQVAQTLAKNPRLAGLVTIGLKASRDAVMMAGQTYAHTEDPGQAAAAGATGGLLRAGGEAAAAGLGRAAQWARKVGPKILDIAGEKVPALASQVNESGVPIETGSAEAPEIARAQQMAGPKVVQNVAQSATRNALDRINATRQYLTDPARLLGTGEEGAQHTFTMEGPGTAESQEGPLLQEPRKKQIGTRIVEAGTGAEGSNIRDINPETGQGPPTSGQPATSARKLRKEPTFQYMSGTKPGSPEPRGDVIRGGGTLTTTDPAEAEGWLSDLKNTQNHPLYDTLPQAQKDAIEAQRANLEHQLGMYHASQPVNYPLRTPVNVDTAVNQVRDWGGAADQIRGAARPVFANFDSASSGELSDQMQKYDSAARRMQTATGAGFDEAEQQMNEADQAINDIFTRHAGNVSRDEYQVARQSWRDSVMLGRLHAVTERMMNGVTAKEAAETGADRFMRRDVAHTRALENFLSRQQNRAILEGLVGADGIQNLKSMTKLLSSPQLATPTKSALKNVANHFVGRASLAGVAAHYMGLPWYVGAGAEAATEGMRYVMRQAVTDPRVGNLLEYAVRHQVDPKIYAPLIARTIMTPMQEQKQPSEEGQQ